MSVFKECLPIFSVLNDENRQKIILILSEFPEGIIVNDITGRLNLSRPAVSHHLKVLKGAGIVDNVNKGVESYYFLTLKRAVENLKKLTSSIEKKCTLR
ncbi:metalloregulator ArsR/SmtB family transcription factor [Clostridium felsineum]|nr:metalloregulator ArsR/SmtB family transcription factor [Clostridium felsineum]